MLSMELQPVISFCAIKKALKAVWYINPFYFNIHGLTHEDFLKFLPTLAFVEGVIYQADEENEVSALKEKEEHWKFLLSFLQEQNLLDDKVEQELQCAQKYYQMEQDMCNGRSFTDEEVIEAVEMKSYDFRVLHRLIYKLMKRPYEEDILSLFKRIEILLEVEGDIHDYAKDIANNSFNVYRMFVKLYGKEGKSRLERHHQMLTSKILEAVADAPPDIQAQFQEMEATYRKIAPIPQIPEPVLEK